MKYVHFLLIYTDQCGLQRSPNLFQRSSANHLVGDDLSNHVENSEHQFKVHEGFGGHIGKNRG